MTPKVPGWSISESKSGALDRLDDVEGVLLAGFGVGLTIFGDHLVGRGQIACDLVAGESAL